MNPFSVIPALYILKDCPSGFFGILICVEIDFFLFQHGMERFYAGIVVRDSLEILDAIMSGVDLSKDRGLKEKLSDITAMYSICTDFERDFPSLTFALATGVGKTRLMGAFITYLYTVHGIRNFFVVAPGTTIYDKLQKDLGDSSSPKYVFKGIGCFVNPPNIITDDDYYDKNLRLWESEINIYVYNIDKFNK